LVEIERWDKETISTLDRVNVHLIDILGFGEFLLVDVEKIDW